MNTALNKSINKSLCSLFRTHFKKEAANLDPLPGAGSDRKYLRMANQEISMIGSYNPNLSEHYAFLYLSAHFHKSGLAVPKIIVSNPDEGTCLLQDLGDKTLLSWVEKNRNETNFLAKLKENYIRALSDLIGFQLDGDKHLDYQQLPVPAFDAQSMHWDLSYFKYYFLKPAGIIFDEKLLEKDFNTLVRYLSAEPLQGFMYRDFQARNIMLHDGKFYYIDFQGGRRGPLQYDLASLLFQAKAALPNELKDFLIDFYILQLQSRKNINTLNFRNSLKGFVLLRLLQVMGAYGFRGWFERKPHFLESIPLLLPNLNWIKLHEALPGKLPELQRLIGEIYNKMENNTLVPRNKLTVSINSFSYRRGIPYDPKGHGGGFVFDCRLLPNPGRNPKYSQLTGMDEAVATWLGNEPAQLLFIENIQKIVAQAVENYIKAGYEHLQINFGCTGGRHRSVYCAEKLAATLKSQKNINIRLKHQELPSQ